MTQEELDVIVSNHKHWLLNDCDGWENMRADLFRADLKGTDLRGTDLRGAILINADLSGANLSGADLRIADLREADLIGANLIGADLSETHLFMADLSRADLSLTNLSRADLIRADLSGANLIGADLNRAKLDEADLSGAKLDEEKNPMACPDKGSFIGWKKCFERSHYSNNSTCIIKLLIPEDAKRSSATTKKCRCSKAKVLEIQDLDGNKLDIKEWRHLRVTVLSTLSTTQCSQLHSKYQTIYKVGEMVYPDSFDECRWHECSNGIHFFMDRQDAVEYWA